MKYYVSSDEAYPIHSITGICDKKTGRRYEPQTIELSDEEKADYDRVCDEFDKWQNKLGIAINWRL